jgi:hypothetical protein
MTDPANDNVRKFELVPPAAPEAPYVSEILVETLRELLEAAEQGEIVGMLAVPLHKDHTASYTVIGRVGGYSMQGAVEVAKDHLIDLNRSGDDA